MGDVKVWEEEWLACPFDEHGGYDAMCGGYEVRTGDKSVTFETLGHDPDPIAEKRAKLSAAAPDMARALLLVLELAELQLNCLGDCLKQEGRHAIVAALKKAGVDLPPLDGDWGLHHRNGYDFATLSQDLERYRDLAYWPSTRPTTSEAP